MRQNLEKLLQVRIPNDLDATLRERAAGLGLERSQVARAALMQWQQAGGPLAANVPTTKTKKAPKSNGHGAARARPRSAGRVAVIHKRGVDCGAKARADAADSLRWANVTCKRCLRRAPSAA